MNVYVESNFVLELALLQEQHVACEALVDLAESGKITLILPVYALVEPQYTLIGRKKARLDVANALSRELNQLARSSAYNPILNERKFTELPLYLNEVSKDDNKRFGEIRARLLATATLIALTPTTLRTAIQYEDLFGNATQDALIYACILEHLSQMTEPTNTFMTKNPKDFDTAFFSW